MPVVGLEPAALSLAASRAPAPILHSQAAPELERRRHLTARAAGRIAAYGAQMRRFAVVPVLALLALPLLSPAALAQEGGGAQIDEPGSQEGVTSGESLRVSGEGCPPGSEVILFFNNVQVGSGRALDDGVFALDFVVPQSVQANVEEGFESSIAVECDGERAATVVAVSAPGASPDKGGAVDELALTGPNTILLVEALIGTMMLAVGIAAVWYSRRWSVGS